VLVTGTLRVPAALKVGSGVGVVSNNGGSLISDRGGGLISDRGNALTVRSRSRRVLADDGAPLSLGLLRGARVYLADAAGNKVPSIPEVRTNDRGEYSFPSVPPGYTLMVVAEVPTASNRVAAFRTLVKVSGLGASSDIDPASTLVTVGVVDGLPRGDLGDFNPGRFKVASDAVAKGLTGENLPDFTDLPSVKARIDALAAQLTELRDLLVELRSDLQDIKRSLGELVSRTASPVPGGSAAPSEAPAGTASSVPTPSASVSPFGVAAPAQQGAVEITPSSVPQPTMGGTAVVTTLAGSGTQGDADGTGAAARFRSPSGVAIDGAGNLYVADRYSHRIRKVTPAGEVTTLAGSTEGYADGAGAAAQFRSPSGIAIDAAGNLYITDRRNQRIRKVTPAGEVSTVAGSTPGRADGTGEAAQFEAPFGIAIDAAGNLFVTDDGNQLTLIRKVTQTGVVTTVAGSTSGYADGVGVAAQFAGPSGIAVDSSGNLFVADIYNHRIRKVTQTGLVTTVAGSTEGYADGLGASARFFNPIGIAVDAAGNLFVADHRNGRIRKVTQTGVVTTLAGSTDGYADGLGAAAQFAGLRGIAVDSSGNLFLADAENHRIRKITFR
jgi:sugar lactone lactonase YvrE